MKLANPLRHWAEAAGLENGSVIMARNNHWELVSVDPEVRVYVSALNPDQREVLADRLAEWSAQLRRSARLTRLASEVQRRLPLENRPESN